LALATDYNFDELKTVKEMIANPSAFAPVAPAKAVEEKTAKAAPVAKAPEPEPEEEAAPAVDLFGGGGGGGSDY